MRTESVDRALLYSLWAGIFLLLFMPFVVSTSTIFPYIVGKAVYARVVISLLFGVWLILAFINPQYRLPRSWILVLFVIYIGISLLSGLLGVSFQRSLWSTYERMQGIVGLSHWLALIIVLSSVVRTIPNWRILLNVNLGVSLIIALIGLAQSQDMNIPGYPYLRIDERLGVTMGNPSFVATFMMINGLIALGFLAQSFRKEKVAGGAPSQARKRRMRRRATKGDTDTALILWRVFWVVVVLLDIWVITLTGTRGSVIGLVAGLATFAVFYVVFGNQRSLKIVASGLASAIILVLLLLLVLRDTPVITSISSSNIFVQRLTEFSLDSDTIQSRLLTFTVGAETIKDRPAFGWGPENYVVAFGRYYKGGTTTLEILDHGHNKPVEELVTRGLLGLIGYLAIWGLLFAVLIRRLRSRDQGHHILLLAVGAALVAYFVQNLFLFDTPSTMLQLVLLVGFVVSLDVSPRKSDGLSDDSDAEIDSGPFAPLRKMIAPALSADQERPSILNAAYIFSSSRLPGLLVVIASLLFVAFSIYVHSSVWHGSTTILKASVQRSSVNDVVRVIDESVNSFSPLSNGPRAILFKNIPEVWGSLSEEDRVVLREYTDEQAKLALVIEPENWRLNLMIAEAYRVITEYDATLENIDTAQGYVLEASRLAPKRRDVIFLVDRIAVVKEDIISKSK